MKKVVGIFAVALMTLGMVSCDKNSAGSDDLYQTVDTSANDNNGSNNSGGSGGN